MEPPPKRSPPFVPSRTFVLQLSTEVQAASGPLVGRVEHLVSRHAIMFQSCAELRAFMVQMLREECEKQEEAAPAREHRAAED